MRNFHLRVFSTALAVLLLALTGCSTGESPSSTPAATPSSTAAASSAPASKPPESVVSSQAPVSSQEVISSEAAVSSQVENAQADEEVQLEVPLIWQMPELPTGCEITSLTMALQYAGFDVDALTMADQYLPKSSNWYYVGDKRYGPDMRIEFAGNPRYEGGAECDAPPIVQAASDFLRDQGSDLQAVNLTGSEPQVLYDSIRAGTPVVVWVTIGMVDREISGGWYVEGSDDYVEWATMDHCVVMSGVDETTVTLNDPLSGYLNYSKTVFEDIYAQRGSQAVILQ